MILSVPGCLRTDARTPGVVIGTMRNVKGNGGKRLDLVKMSPPPTSCWWRSVPPSKLSWRDQSWRRRTDKLEVGRSENGHRKKKFLKVFLFCIMFSLILHVDF